MIKKIGIAVVIILIGIQFIRPEKNNNPVEADKQITAVAEIPENVETIFKKACYDCHSNNTVYPWYSHIQPIYFWLDGHIKDGKKHFNFDEFASYKLRKQYHKMEEFIEMVKEDNMPLKSYVLIHDDAKLSVEEKTTITNWAQSIMDTMKAHHHIDSLVKPKS